MIRASDCYGLATEQKRSEEDRNSVLSGDEGLNCGDGSATHRNPSTFFDEQTESGENFPAN